MHTLIEIPPSPPDGSPTTSIDIPSGTALPMWVILAFMIFRELGLGSLLKSVQEGQQKSNASKESLTEKVVTQVLEQYGELTAAVEKLTDRIEALTEETKASRSGNLPLVAGNSRNGSSL